MKLIGRNVVLATAIATAAVGAGGFYSAPAAHASTRTCSSSTPLSQRPTVRYGDTGTCVRELQLRLNRHGYGLSTDGIFGPATLSATKRYQSSVKVVSDGIVGPITWGKLLVVSTPAPPPPPPSVSSCSSHPTVRYGSRGTCVVTLQKLLVSHGYSVGASGADGIFGYATLSAVKSYQRAHGLVADGIVGPLTWSKLLGKVVSPPPPPPSTSYNRYGCGNAGSKVLLVFDDFPLSSTAFRSLIDTAKANNIGIGVAPNGMYVPGRAPVSYARQKGMLVVDHTWDHKDLTTLSNAGIVWEITRPNIGSNYVRPPYGSYNSRVSSILAQYHKYNCLWNLDPRDWDGRSPQAAANYIIANARPGSTAVVHMNHLGTQPSQLVRIKNGLAARGIRMCAPWSKPTTNTMPAVYCS